jgi:enterochelin esterase-like enzyme
MPALLDNLIAGGEVAPLSLAFVDNAAADRVQEYMRAEGLGRLMSFFQEELLPEAADFWELRTEPGSHGVLGSSASGYAAMSLGIHHPDIFGNVFCQAGGFGVTHIGAPDLTAIIRDREERLPLRIHLDCGTYDFLIEGNRAMRRFLEERGYPLDYQEYHAGHNYPAWREALPRGLGWLFPAERRS